jgi:hypothetical protein
MTDDRNRLLRRAGAIPRLPHRIRARPPGRPVLLRVRDEVFTLRETLGALAVPHALVDNAVGTGTSRLTSVAVAKRE